MAIPLRTRLFSNHLLILVLGMGLAAALSWRAVEAAYVRTLSQNLLAQAELTAAALQGTALPAPSGEPYLQAANVVPGIHTRVLGDQGAIVVGLSGVQGEAPVQVPLAENQSVTTAEELLRRPEIAQALQGQASTSIRRVGTAGNRRVLYAAAPILSAGGSVSGLVYLATPLPAAGLPSSLLLELAAAGLAAAGLAALAGSLLARRIARPVETTARAASAVGAGNLDQRLQVDGPVSELNSLGQAFNQMTESLRLSERAKNAFVADVAHELRTPLTVVKGTIETLEDGALDDLAGRGPLLSAMHRETDRLIRLVNGLLVLIRADAGTLNLDLRPVDLGELARARCEQLAPLAARHRVHLAVSAPDPAGSARVRGDRDRLAQVLDNLLENAIRFSPAGSTVEVVLRNQAGECECQVRDQGPGIPADHLPLIFERFYRADVSRDRQAGGAGLGLSIARALVLAQSGRINAECPPGGGTVLTFWLPSA